MEIRKNLTALIVIILFGIFLWVGSQTEEPTKRYSFKEESQKTALENKDSDHNSKEDLFFDEFFDEEPEVLGEEIELDEFESQSIDSGFNIPVSSIAELEKIELKYVIDGDTIKLADN
ncbi:MAG: hypothetical protein GTN40_00285, partial [Candidatus Aenigmarchaeota archaeon]|nr:hypothetical protein [Candidatus Aenigmarchaeota archaeon]